MSLVTMIAVGAGLVMLLTCATGMLVFAVRSARRARSAAEQEDRRRAAEARAAAAEQDNQALSRFEAQIEATEKRELSEAS